MHVLWALSGGRDAADLVFRSRRLAPTSFQTRYILPLVCEQPRNIHCGPNGSRLLRRNWRVCKLVVFSDVCAARIFRRMHNSFRACTCFQSLQHPKHDWSFWDIVNCRFLSGKIRSHPRHP